MLSSPTLQLNLISHLPRSKRIFNNEEDSEKKDDERIVNKLQLMELKDKRNFQSRRKNILVRTHIFPQNTNYTYSKLVILDFVFCEIGYHSNNGKTINS